MSLLLALTALGGGATNYTLSGAAGSYTYTGQSASFTVGKKLSGAAGSYAYTGQAGALTYTPGSASIAYSLSGSYGVYSVSGQNASLVYSGKVENVAIGGGGDYRFLDSEYHKNRISPKVRKIIKRIARKAVETQLEAKTDAQNEPVANDWTPSLIRVLEQEKIAWNRFYADLLAKQINDQISAQIRMQFQLMGLYEQIRIEEEDEEALMLLLMEF